jgi:hypothetical protein
VASTGCGVGDRHLAGVPCRSAAERSLTGSFRLAPLSPSARLG